MQNADASVYVLNLLVHWPSRLKVELGRRGGLSHQQGLSLVVPEHIQRHSRPLNLLWKWF